MDLSTNWLGDWVPSAKGDPRRVAATLEQMGYELDGVTAAEAGLGEVVLVAVAARDAHPAADRLSVLTVRGRGAEMQVVTAAPNGRPGDKLWYAPPGTVLPDGRTIEVEQFRGVRSEGMLLSAEELGYQQAGAGLWVWDGPGAAGDTWAELMGSDTVLHLTLTANLAQFGHSVLGAARELAAAWREELPTLPAAPDVTYDAPLIRVEAPDLCPRYALALFRCNPSAARTPWEWQRRLTLAGVRLIHPVVDATNAVRVELGQPLHAFDRAAVTLPIVVRRASAGESLELLDGRTLTLVSEDLVIADAGGPIALAGVMGGQRAAVSRTTTEVLLESAHFDRTAVYRTARRHAVLSDAAARFGRGTDPGAVLTGITRFAYFLQQFGVAAELQSAGSAGEMPPVKEVPFQPDRLRVWTGLDLEDPELVRHLGRAGFSVQGSRVAVPSWRPDIEGPQDLAEEVARLVGMEAVPVRLPPRPGLGGEDPDTAEQDRLRDWLAAAGGQEVVTKSFIAPGVSEALGLPVPVHRIQNPLREEEAVMRTSVWPGLLEVARYNRDRGRERLEIFEVGPVYLGRPEAPRERVEVGMLMTLGIWPNLHEAEQRTVYHLKGMVEELSRRFHWRLEWREWAEAPGSGALHPGRSLHIWRDGERWGELGELHPSVLTAWRLPRTAVARWYVPATVVSSLGPFTRPAVPSPYPAIRRDLSLRIPTGMAWRTIDELLHLEGGPHLEAVHAFDRYEDPAAGLSVTVALRFRAIDRTLTDREVDEAVAAVLGALSARGIERRG